MPVGGRDRDLASCQRLDSPDFKSEANMRSMLLWLIGIPLPIILILWLVSGHA